MFETQMAAIGDEYLEPSNIEAITSEVRMPDASEVALSIYRPAIALKVFHRFGRSLKHKYYPSKEGGLSRCTT